MLQNKLSYAFPIEASDFTKAGDAAGKIKKILKLAGLPATVIRRVAIIAYEAEMNIVIHSVGGSLSLDLTSTRVEMASQDNGPGIPDIDLALQEGYSTASDEVRALGFGAGMGLPNIRRNADHFCIQSEVGVGTNLEVWIDIGVS